MTQTIVTPNGRNSFWIEADYGQGRRGLAREASWQKITLAEYLNRVDFEDSEALEKDLPNFTRGYAYQAEYCGVVELFSTHKEAREWARSQFA